MCNHWSSWAQVCVFECFLDVCFVTCLHASCKQLLIAFAGRNSASWLVSCVCSFVVSSLHNSKANFTKLYAQLGTSLAENWLHFGSHPPLDPDPDPELVWRILPHFEMGHFSALLLISLEKLTDLRENFGTDVHCFGHGMMSSINFGTHPDARYRLRIWTPDTQHIHIALFIVRLTVIVFWIYKILYYFDNLNFG